MVRDFRQPAVDCLYNPNQSASEEDEAEYRAGTLQSVCRQSPDWDECCREERDHKCNTYAEKAERLRYPPLKEIPGLNPALEALQVPLQFVERHSDDNLIHILIELLDLDLFTRNMRRELLT
ncbi:protein of unknown function [Micropruina glycogenica]|uniref:Uncharacterized protein n=1 Tax=Micropruina glycogenica TaxID=75385 RepID=A0A2N9JE50_9ACTN|nr:protein of unknown function [Micropruina glycogenica]